MKSTMLVEEDCSSDESHRGKATTTRRGGGATSGDWGATARTGTSSDLPIYHVTGCTGFYTDVVSATIQSVKRILLSPKSKRKGPRGGVSEPFPSKLYDMLVGLEAEGISHVASWRDHGRCFEIADPAVFAGDVMPRYFKQSKLTSFQRQLNLYGFQRVATGVDKGCFYHPLFLRGRPDICRILLRTRVKGNYGTVTRENSGPVECDSFHDLPVCPASSTAASSPAEIATAADVSSSADDEDDFGVVQQQRYHRHQATTISLPSGSPRPTDKDGDDEQQHQHVQFGTIMFRHLVPAVERQELQQELARTPHYENVPVPAAAVSCIEPDFPCPTVSSSPSSLPYNNEYIYYPTNHYHEDYNTTNSYNTVSPTHDSSNNTINKGWFPVSPAAITLPEDDDNVVDGDDDVLADFPIWGRAFQCMDDDGIQAYERCIERRYRPCPPW